MENTQIPSYERASILSIVLIALGVVYSGNLYVDVALIGSLFLAVGSLFLIVSLVGKRKEEEIKNQHQ